MADHTEDGPLEMGAKMDYEEHTRTYNLFISLAKYGALVCMALLVSMAFGFFSSGGFIPATILFFLISALGIYLLR